MRLFIAFLATVILLTGCSSTPKSLPPSEIPASQFETTLPLLITTTFSQTTLPSRLPTTSSKTSQPPSSVTPSNIIITSSLSPISPITSVILKILQNDTTALVFGFDFLDASGQKIIFAGANNVRFVGSIWQGHLSGAPISYIVQIDIRIRTCDDTVTVPYSIQNFYGIEQSQPVNFDMRIEGLASSSSNDIILERYWFQKIADSSVYFTGRLINLPSSISGKIDD
jgi:hypothetical protein